jgi:hypothetical protein
MNKAPAIVMLNTAPRSHEPGRVRVNKLADTRALGAAQGALARALFVDRVAAVPLVFSL